MELTKEQGDYIKVLHKCLNDFTELIGEGRLSKDEFISKMSQEIGIPLFMIVNLEIIYHEAILSKKEIKFADVSIEKMREDFSLIIESKYQNQDVEYYFQKLCSEVFKNVNFKWEVPSYKTKEGEK